MHLDAERAADILADHAHLRLPEAQMQRRDILHHVRRLGTLIDGQPRFRGVPVSHHRARLQCHAGVPSKDKLRLYNLVGVGKGLVNGAGVVISLEGQVVT